MKFLDFFAGIGGFRRGMELAGHECVGFCEFDKFATASYTSMHLITEEQRDYLSTLDLKQRQKEILKEEYRNGEWYANDIRRVNADDIPEADCWCFGFPCQDISVAGKQLGFTGNRSSLFFRVMRLLGDLEEEKRPTWLFIENVKNLLSVNGGWDFGRLLIEMDEVGYDAEWEVLNSKDFGVPQNRERCFIIGHLRSRGGSEVFPVEGTDGAHRVHGVGHRDGYRRNSQVFERDGITEALDTGQGGGRGHHTIEVIGVTRPSAVADRTRILSGGGHKSSLTSDRLQRSGESGVVCVGNTNPSGHGMNGNCYFSEGINPTLTCNKNEGNRIAVPVLTPDRATKRQNGRRFKEDGDDSFTLTSQDRHGVAISIEPMKMSGYKLSESEDIAKCLNCTDSQKVFGANQSHTMVGYNATSQRGGGVTDTALALNARDYKGLSGSSQMMTAAAMCFSSIKASELRSETSPTALPPGKTEAFQDIARKGR